MSSQTQLATSQLPGALDNAQPGQVVLQEKRLLFIDNLRIQLICGVLLDHLNDTYGAIGDWDYHDPIIAPGVRERLAQRREEIGEVMAKVLENLQGTEGAKHSSLDPTILAALLLSLFDGLALQKILDPAFDLDASYQLLAHMLHRLFSPDG
jgi:hypothetical protein